VDGIAQLEHRVEKILPAAGQNRPNVAEKRRWWDILMTRKSAGKLVFLDETAASTNMARRYDRGPKSARVVSRVPHGH